MLVVANLSRFVQYVQLDLKDYTGVVPEEVLGRTRFPPITDAPYLLTLGPHAFIWFSLPRRVRNAGGHARRAGTDAAALPVLPGKRPLEQTVSTGQLGRARSAASEVPRA